MGINIVLAMMSCLLCRAHGHRRAAKLGRAFSLNGPRSNYAKRTPLQSLAISMLASTEVPETAFSQVGIASRNRIVAQRPRAPGRVSRTPAALQMSVGTVLDFLPPPLKVIVEVSWPFLAWIAVFKPKVVVDIGKKLDSMLDKFNQWQNREEDEKFDFGFIGEWTRPDFSDLFRQLDTDKDGSLSIRDVRESLLMIGVPMEEHIGVVFALADGDSSHTTFTSTEFCSRLPREICDQFDQYLTKDRLLPSLYLSPEAENELNKEMPKEDPLARIGKSLDEIRVEMDAGKYGDKQRQVQLQAEYGQKSLR